MSIANAVNITTTTTNKKLAIHDLEMKDVICG
jgi:hypothetical protein